MAAPLIRSWAISADAAVHGKGKAELEDVDGRELRMGNDDLVEIFLEGVILPLEGGRGDAEGRKDLPASGNRSAWGIPLSSGDSTVRAPPAVSTKTLMSILRSRIFVLFSLLAAEMM